MPHGPDKRHILSDSLQYAMCEIEEICKRGCATLKLGVNDLLKVDEMDNSVAFDSRFRYLFWFTAN